jgi:exopolyphosphatase/guanosine-5'-triphosphate,3'-diphosphate pyrophosphatase
MADTHYIVARERARAALAELMVALLAQHNPPASRYAPNRNRSLPRLAGGLGCSKHEQRVASIALRLFDLLGERHRLGKSYRNILRIGALLHDAGRRLGVQNHHITGAQLVLGDQSIDLSEKQRRAVAYLVRYHRGKLPDTPVDEDSILDGDRKRLRKLRVLLGLLRAADGLDSRRTTPPTLIVKRKARKLRIRCLVVDGSLDKARRAFQRPRKFEMLRQTLGLRVAVRVDRLLT